jgi:hypothetical protein
MHPVDRWSLSPGHARSRGLLRCCACESGPAGRRIVNLPSARHRASVAAPRHRGGDASGRPTAASGPPGDAGVVQTCARAVVHPERIGGRSVGVWRRDRQLPTKVPEQRTVVGRRVGHPPASRVTLSTWWSRSGSTWTAPWADQITPRPLETTPCPVRWWPILVSLGLQVDRIVHCPGMISTGTRSDDGQPETFQPRPAWPGCW